MGLVLVARVLNILVPFLYKKVVDEFAAITSAAHVDDKPQVFDFWTVGSVSSNCQKC